MDGLLWGQEFRREDVGFGIQKLVIQAVIEDEKVQLQDIEDAVRPTACPKRFFLRFLGVLIMHST